MLPMIAVTKSKWFWRLKQCYPSAGSRYSLLLSGLQVNLRELDLLLLLPFCRTGLISATCYSFPSAFCP